jgi:phosphoribosylformylglycinamidine synthase
MYLREVLGREDGAPPPVDLAAEKRNGDFVRGLVADGLTACVHDLSDGGLVAAAVEMALASDTGLALMLQAAAADHALFFGEDQARYLIAVAQERLDDLDARAQAAGVPYEVAGRAGGDEVSFTGSAGLLAALQLTELRRAHEAWLPAYMGEAAG